MKGEELDIYSWVFENYPLASLDVLVPSVVTATKAEMWTSSQEAPIHFAT